MKTEAERGRSTRQDLDLRVRERHLISGLLDPKAVERYLAELPDLEAQADSISIEQPALGGEGGGRSGQGSRAA
jgi:type II secretory pathway component PulK